MFYLILLGIFILLSLVNMVFLYSKEKFKKLSMAFYGISLVYSIIAIFVTNVTYRYNILNGLPKGASRIRTYLDLLKQLNIDYIIISLIMLVAFFVLVFLFRVFGVKYIILYDLIVGIQVILHVYLFFFKGIIITKDNIDLSLLSGSLMWYWLNFAFIPLVYSKHSKLKIM